MYHLYLKITFPLFTWGTSMYYVSRFWGIFDPTPPLSSKVSICHDPPLVLRKAFLPLPHTKPGKKSTYVLLKGQKQSLYLPEKNKNSFQCLLWVEFLIKFGRLCKLFSIFSKLWLRKYDPSLVTFGLQTANSIKSYIQRNICFYVSNTK